MLRVIGGAWKGRKLAMPPGRAVRPTSARAREAVFDILAVEEAAFLDLFAGTGAVGIEALSRGAARAVFVERAPAALSVLRLNLETVGAGARAEVRPADVASWTPEGAFDVAFADPPYDEALYALALAAAAAAVAPGGDVVLERAERHPAPRHDALEPLRSYRHGEAVLERYRRRG